MKSLKRLPPNHTMDVQVRQITFERRALNLASRRSGQSPPRASPSARSESLQRLHRRQATAQERPRLLFHRLQQSHVCEMVPFRAPVLRGAFPPSERKGKMNLEQCATSLGGVESLCEQRLVSDPGADPCLGSLRCTFREALISIHSPLEHRFGRPRRSQE